MDATQPRTFCHLSARWEMLWSYLFIHFGNDRPTFMAEESTACLFPLPAFLHFGGEKRLAFVPVSCLLPKGTLQKKKKNSL